MSETLEPPPAAVPAAIRVILRRWRPTRMDAVSPTIIALFPDRDEGNGHIGAYERIGQHAAANYQDVLRRTDPVDMRDHDADDMLTELRAIGYDPRVILRAHRSPRCSASQPRSRARRIEPLGVPVPAVPFPDFSQGNVDAAA